MQLQTTVVTEEWATEQICFYFIVTRALWPKSFESLAQNSLTYPKSNLILFLFTYFRNRLPTFVTSEKLIAFRLVSARELYT
jgi:hypothetical protein